MGILGRLFGRREPEPALAAPPFILARGRGFTFEVVGEAAYQANLDLICGGKCAEGHRLEVGAQLCFQEDNPVDPNAIVVLISGMVVGYIPASLSEEMRDEILGINSEERPVFCAAKIVGGWDYGDGDEGHYGVKLNLAANLREQ